MSSYKTIYSQHKTFAISALFLTSIFTGQAFAEGKSQSGITQQLLASCETLKVDQKDTRTSMCTTYIQGFLAGAWGINNVKAKKLIKKGEDSPTWTERAYRNRVGKRGERFSIKPITYYCVPEDDPEAKIIKKFNHDLVSPIKTLQQLNTQIYSAIKAVCPSDKTDGK